LHRLGESLPGEISMLHELPLVLCVFFLGSACGALLVSLHRYVHRARIVDEFTKSLQARERALPTVHDCGVSSEERGLSRAID